LWNAGHPQYLGILFSDRIYPATRNQFPTRSLSKQKNKKNSPTIHVNHYDPVYDGISVSLQHAGLHGLLGCFSCFFVWTGIVLEIGCGLRVLRVTGYELRVIGYGNFGLIVPVS